MTTSEHTACYGNLFPTREPPTTGEVSNSSLPVLWASCLGDALSRPTCKHGTTAAPVLRLMAVTS